MVLFRARDKLMDSFFSLVKEIYGGTDGESVTEEKTPISTLKKYCFVLPNLLAAHRCTDEDFLLFKLWRENQVTFKFL